MDPREPLAGKPHQKSRPGLTSCPGGPAAAGSGRGPAGRRRRVGGASWAQRERSGARRSGRRGTAPRAGRAGGDMEDGVLKEGFLVKRGHIVHNWKVRWFILRQNTLLYYKLQGGRKVTPPKGRILLDGCTITCPCLEYENRPLLIKLKTQTSTEYFLEACSREERDAWAFEITGAIHAGQPGKVQQLHILRNSFKLPPHISLHRIVDKLHDSSSGIRPSPNMEQGSTYKKTFLGSSLVDWLISNSFAASRLEAVTLASMLMEENFLRPVGARSTGAIRSGDLAEQFLDDSTALYTFAESCKKKISPKEDIDLSTVELSGTVVKQGYLAKQGHKRKNWKVRRFVLRKDPAFLHYYDPSKEENRPVGGFSLRGSLVSALEDNGVPAGVKGNVQGNLFKVITKDDTHYYIQASSKAERSEWIEAIKKLT
ncbi:pleckstrin-2 isoform X1 [Camelus dromedarius]|uniref:Pleckstrin-2 n=2 Tax=Camelus TaxID=9836 RepID=A0A8B8T776_CAMFR|nr:pleckstrin-2 isoform X1 [Camelus dromedarius]XP_032338110.1 pleckstrin-2 isoform X1 [Camelus ferus]